MDLAWNKIPFFSQFLNSPLNPAKYALLAGWHPAVVLATTAYTLYTLPWGRDLVKRFILDRFHSTSTKLLSS